MDRNDALIGLMLIQLMIAAGYWVDGWTHRRAVEHNDKVLQSLVTHYNKTLNKLVGKGVFSLEEIQ